MEKGWQRCPEQVAIFFFEFGPKKILISVLRHTFLAIFSQGPYFTLKMVDSGLRNVRGWNLRKKLA
jgi:hypothetical protein